MRAYSSARGRPRRRDGDDMDDDGRASLGLPLLRIYSTTVIRVTSAFLGRNRASPRHFMMRFSQYVPCGT
jgi:hypothetical protein